MRIRKNTVEKQIQQILLYIQGNSADVQKENVLEDLKIEVLKYKMAGEFLADLRKKFGKRYEEIVKAVELRRLEQGRKIIEEFIQEFRKVARESKYKKRLITLSGEDL